MNRVLDFEIEERCGRNQEWENMRGRNRQQETMRGGPKRGYDALFSPLPNSNFFFGQFEFLSLNYHIIITIISRFYKKNL
jgi:hypothetical protein